MNAVTKELCDSIDSLGRNMIAALDQLRKERDQAYNKGFEAGFKAATQQQAIMNNLITKVIGT